jgi:hypothetical protein
MPDDLPDIRLRGEDLLSETALKDLLLNGDSRSLDEAQQRIDGHVSRQSLAIENGTWPVSGPLPDYAKEASYPVQEALPQWWEWDSGDYAEQTTVAKDVLPSRKTYLDSYEKPLSDETERWGEIRYDLVAKFSAQGTRWGLATFSWDNFAGELYRAEIVKTFDTLQEASTWLSSERERAAVENRAEKALGGGDPVEKMVVELQMASDGANGNRDRGSVAQFIGKIAEKTHDLGRDR